MGFRVHVERVSKRYVIAPGQVLAALDDVSFTIAGGQAVALVGPSGSGKSTMLHVLGAMDTIDDGEIHVGEHDIANLDRARRVAYRRTVGFVFQRFHLLPALSVEDNIVAPLLPYRTNFDKHARARRLAAAVGLEGREAALPSRLSGGQQQRVAIARALINQPGLLLADEPTGNLDTATGQDILQLVLELREQHGMTVVIATHDLAIANACDQVIRLRDGQVDITVDA